MPSSLDYFIAGAKDFGDDVKNVWSGESKGPSMEHRKALADMESKSAPERKEESTVDESKWAY